MFPLHFHSHLRLTLPPPGSPSLHLRRTTNTFHAQKRGCGVTLERHREDKHGPCARLTRTNREGIPNVVFARRRVCIFFCSHAISPFHLHLQPASCSPSPLAHLLSISVARPMLSMRAQKGVVVHFALSRGHCTSFWFIVPPLQVTPSLACSVASLSHSPGH